MLGKFWDRLRTLAFTVLFFSIEKVDVFIEYTMQAGSVLRIISKLSHLVR